MQEKNCACVSRFRKGPPAYHFRVSGCRPARPSDPIAVQFAGST